MQEHRVEPFSAKDYAALKSKVKHRRKRLVVVEAELQRFKGDEVGVWRQKAEWLHNLPRKKDSLPAEVQAEARGLGCDKAFMTYYSAWIGRVICEQRCVTAERELDEYEKDHGLGEHQMHLHFCHCWWELTDDTRKQTNKSAQSLC